MKYFTLFARFISAGFLTLITSLNFSPANSQVMITPEEQQRARNMDAQVRAYREKIGKIAPRVTSESTVLATVPGSAPLSSLGAQWQIRSIRYTCDAGVAVSTRQQFSNADFAAAVTDRRDALPLPGQRAKTQTELDALEDLDASLKKLKPLMISFKFKKYELTPERGALGWHYVNRAHGISWGQRQGKGILKNTFSGRIIAQDCRAGAPYVTDAPESTDEDLSAFAKRP